MGDAAMNSGAGNVEERKCTTARLVYGKTEDSGYYLRFTTIGIDQRLVTDNYWLRGSGSKPKLRTTSRNIVCIGVHDRYRLQVRDG